MSDKIQEAFNKVKKDILELREEISSIKNQIKDLFDLVEKICKGSEKIQHIPLERNLKKKKINELSPNFHFSIGNEGVPTDKQTDRQTDRQTLGTSSALFLEDLRLLQRKIQQLTRQEFLVLSTLYLLGNERKYVTYRDIALKTKLSESSIRDYIAKLVRKGVPIQKEKFNNKQVILKIPSEFRELAPLDLLIRMRAEEY